MSFPIYIFNILVTSSILYFSLLLEIFGHYGNNEIHTFHRLALNLGVFYARMQPKGLSDHMMRSFVLTQPDIDEIFNVTKGYFDNKAYMSNVKK